MEHVAHSPPGEPEPFVSDPNWMTLLGAFAPRRGARRFLARAEDRVLAVDGDGSLRVRCNWQPGPAPAPALVLVHGLASDGNAAYAVGTARKAHLAGFHTLRIDIPNCGGTAHLTRRPYHAGMTRDILGTIRFLHTRRDVTEVCLAGFSMGGNQILNLLAELGSDGPRLLAGAGALSPVVDVSLSAACVDGEGPWRALFRINFLRSLKRMAAARSRQDGRPLGRDFFRALRTIREFDEAFTSQRGGFQDAGDYYAKTSCQRCVQDIRVDTLLLTARDDPMIPPESFGQRAFRTNRRLKIEISRHGGHLGFLARERPRGAHDRRWAEQRLVDFLKGCVGRGQAAG